MKDNPKWEIIHGDSLTVLESFPPSTFDAVITDPPYASGGRTQAEKSKATAKKYSSMGGNAPPDFDGDAKDQRSWTRWAAEWLYLARRALMDPLGGRVAVSCKTCSQARRAGLYVH